MSEGAVCFGHALYVKLLLNGVALILARLRPIDFGATRDFGAIEVQGGNNDPAQATNVTNHDWLDVLLAKNETFVSKSYILLGKPLFFATRRHDVRHLCVLPQLPRGASP